MKNWEKLRIEIRIPACGVSEEERIEARRRSKKDWKLGFPKLLGSAPWSWREEWERDLGYIGVLFICSVCILLRLGLGFADYTPKKHKI